MSFTHDEEEVRSVLDKLAFTSPLNLDSVLARGPDDGVEDGAPEPGAQGDARPGFRFWERLRVLDQTQPCLLETKRGRQPYPFILEGFSYSEFPSLLEAFEELEGDGSEEGKSSSTVIDGVEKALHQSRGKARGLEREMEAAARPDELREQANLLLARLREVQRGSSQVVLKGFQGEDVTLHLDPSLSPHENAEALFEEAARMERASQRLPPLLKKTADRIEQLQELRTRLLSGEATEEEVGALLSPAREKKRWHRAGKGPRIPYRQFRSSSGLEIRVGRGPGDNDALTFRHSHPEDIWLHARGASGAHVILRWTKPDTPPARDLTEAAILAALHSGARNAQVVPVDWTRRKYVRKPRKGPPGTVVTEKTETLFVQTDPGLKQRLIWED
jgi:predicted ribosome quality control (RQC) complex YloA/Tae2 family protein